MLYFQVLFYIGSLLLLIYHYLQWIPDIYRTGLILGIRVITYRNIWNYSSGYSINYSWHSNMLLSKLCALMKPMEILKSVTWCSLLKFKAFGGNCWMPLQGRQRKPREKRKIYMCVQGQEKMESGWLFVSVKRWILWWYLQTSILLVECSYISSVHPNCEEIRVMCT